LGKNRMTIASLHFEYRLMSGIGHSVKMELLGLTPSQ